MLIISAMIVPKSSNRQIPTRYLSNHVEHEDVVVEDVVSIEQGGTITIIIAIVAILLDPIVGKITITVARIEIRIEVDIEAEISHGIVARVETKAINSYPVDRVVVPLIAIITLVIEYNNYPLLTQLPQDEFQFHHKARWFMT